MILTLELPEYLSPGLNRWQRMHFRTRGREKQRVTGLLVHALMSQDWRTISGPVPVVYTRIRRSGPEMDEDNLAGSFKVIGDALQGLWVIENDQDIRLDARQERRATGQRAAFWGTRLVIGPFRAPRSIS